ncbi:hypothetical protein [Tenacibaculum phage PTm5]|nr:hypothetical protein [Tenacibaculum phage PTm5]
MKKLLLVGLTTNHTFNKNYHTGGYTYWLYEVLSREFDVTIVRDNNIDDILSLDINDYTLFVSEGSYSSDSKTHNFYGGISLTQAKKIELITKYDIAYQEDRSIKEYTHHIVNKANKTHKLNIRENIPTFKKLSELIPKSNKLILGDSHALSVLEPFYDLKMIYGKTLYSFIKDGLKSLVDSEYDTLQFYAGNIDIRYHFHRHNVTSEELKTYYISLLEREISALNLKQVEIVQPLPIEPNKYNLNKKYHYYGQPYHGTYKYRFSMWKEYCSLLHDMCINNGWKYVEWCPSIKNNRSALKTDVLASKKDVHMRPKYYMHINKLKDDRESI